MKISPDLIPHSEFHTGHWLRSVENPGWYYFRKGKSSNRIRSRKFIQSVDAPLRELVKFLHARKIRTTPSCSGHHFSERDFEKIYAGLELDRDKIRNEGLELVDIETGKRLFYRDRNYLLPWTKEEFIEKIINYQKKGIIGLRVDGMRKARKKIIRFLELINLQKLAGVNVALKQKTIFIFAGPENDGYNSRIWKRVTKVAKEVFR